MDLYSNKNDFVESLDCIQGLVECMFSDIKNTDQRSFKCPSHPLSEEHLQVDYGMVDSSICQRI